VEKKYQFPFASGGGKETSLEGGKGERTFAQFVTRRSFLRN